MWRCGNDVLTSYLFLHFEEIRWSQKCCTDRSAEGFIRKLFKKNRHSTTWQTPDTCSLAWHKCVYSNNSTKHFDWTRGKSECKSTGTFNMMYHSTSQLFLSLIHVTSHQRSVENPAGVVCGGGSPTVWCWVVQFVVFALVSDRQETWLATAAWHGLLQYGADPNSYLNPQL